MAKALEIPEDVVDEVVKALEYAIGFAMSVNNKEAVNHISSVAMRFDEAINDALATEA